MKTLPRKRCAAVAVVFAALCVHADVIIQKDSRKIVAIGKNGKEGAGTIRLTGCENKRDQDFPSDRFALNKGDDCNRPIEQSLPKQLGLECGRGRCRVADVSTARIYFPDAQSEDVVTVSVTDDAVVFTHRSVQHTIRRQ
jgi:hypothetical protein